MDFEKQVTDNYKFIKEVCTKLTGNAYDADDLAQEVTIAALRHRDKFKEGTNLRGWLRTICKNLFVNSYRKQKKSIIDYSDDLSMYSQMINSDNMDDMIEKDVSEGISEDVVEAIEGLGLEYKNIFILAHVYDYSYDDIAKIKGMPIGTIKSRLFRAREIIRPLLEDRAKEWGIKYHLKK